MDANASTEVMQALKKVAASHGFASPKFEISSGSSVGDGYSSVMLRAAIRDEEGQASDRDVIVKTAHREAAGTPLLNSIFGAEGTAYSEVFPDLANFAGLKEPLPWASCLHVSLGDPAGPVGSAALPCIVLADLRAEGFTMADRAKGADEAHCRLALSQLARYHGAGIAYRHLRPEAFRGHAEALARSWEPLRDAMSKFVPPYANCQDLAKERFPEGSEVYRKLKDLFGAFASDFPSFEAFDADGPANAFVHGDCHFMNMMFKYDKATGEPTTCRLLDFQLVRFNCTTRDLCYLLFAATNKALRDRHWDSLLRGYFQELQDTMRGAGCDHPDEVYSWDQFMEAMRFGSRFGLCMSPVLLNVYLADSEQAQRMRDEVQTAFNEPEMEAISMEFNASPQLKERFTDMVQSLVDWGWL